MDNSKPDIFSWKYRTTIGISKILGMAFVIFVTLTVIPIYTEKAHSQSTLYRCDTGNGENSSAVNCFNTTTARSNSSIVPMTNQTNK